MSESDKSREEAISEHCSVCGLRRDNALCHCPEAMYARVAELEAELQDQINRVSELEEKLSNAIDRGFEIDVKRAWAEDMNEVMETKLAASQDTIARLQEKTEILEQVRDLCLSHVTLSCFCPCCGSDAVCDHECTYHDDCPNGAVLMDESRAFMAEIDMAFGKVVG